MDSAKLFLNVPPKRLASFQRELRNLHFDLFWKIRENRRVFQCQVSVCTSIVDGRSTFLLHESPHIIAYDLLSTVLNLNQTTSVLLSRIYLSNLPSAAGIETIQTNRSKPRN